MPLTLLCGPFHPTLEDAFVARLQSAGPGPGKRLAVVTASREMSDRLQRLVAGERGLTFLNVQFLTLHALALDVLRSARAPLPTVVNDPLFHEQLMENLLREDGVSKDSARALAGAHRETIRDLLDAGVDPVHFREHFTDLELPNAAAWERLLTLTQRTRARLEAMGVAMSADLARRAAALVEADGRLLQAYDAFFYYGFYDLNGAQADFFSAVAQAAPVTLFFPYRKDHPDWAFAEKFLNVKLGVGGARVDHLSADKNDAPATFRLVSVSGERDELWWVAKEILRLREGPSPVPWESMGVVARGVEPYAALVSEVFTAHGIPFSISDGGPGNTAPWARWMLDLFRLSDRPHDRDLLSDVVEGPFVSADVLSPDARSAAVSYLQQAGPRAGWGWVRAESTRPADGPSSLASEEEGGTAYPTRPPAALISFVDALADSAAGPASWADHARRARTRVERFLSPTLDEAEEIWLFLDALLAGLSSYDLFSAPILWSDFVEAFGQALARSRRPGTGAAQGVRVRGVMEARGESFQVLFMVGLKEGVFPRVIREDPLLGDDLRRFLRDPGGYWILPKLEGYEEEKLLFAGLVASCRGTLYCLYSRSRADGRAEVPSLYVRDLARSQGISWEDQVERLARPPLEKWKSIDPVFLTEQEAGLVDLLEGITGLPPELQDIRDRAAVLSRGGKPGPWDGWVETTPALRERWAERGLSPSALETYVQCPFKLFLGRWVGVRSVALPFEDGSLSAWALGDLQHRVLRFFYTDPGPWEALTPLQCDRRIHEGVERVFERDTRLGAGLYPLVEQVLRERMEQQLRAFVQRDIDRLRAEGFFPDRLEWAVRSAANPSEPRWTGRLDRVDWNPRTQEYRVVDYKNTPPQRPLAERVDRGEVHQAPLYLDLLASAAPWGPDARPAGVRYEYLATNETDVFSADQWRGARETLRARRAVLWNEMLAGHFSIRPDESPGGACRFCDFARACRKAHGPSRRRAEALLSVEEEAGA